MFGGTNSRNIACILNSLFVKVKLKADAEVRVRSGPVRSRIELERSKCISFHFGTYGYPDMT